jgi:hypothetical protein
METKDPMAAMASKEVADRAAACRDLSSMGEVTHLEALWKLVATDKSPGVRLSAAAAAADILSRCRLGAPRDALSDDQRDVLMEMFSRIDPGINAGIFPILACLDRPRSLTLICGGLRDPRGDVRLGAAVGLMRLCSTIGVVDEPSTEQTVVALLGDTRHRPDAVAQIARVCAAVGFRSGIEVIRHLHLSGTHADTIVEALGVLDGASHPLVGVWYSDGNDAGETNPKPDLGPALMVFDGRGALFHNGKNWAVETNFQPQRRMFIRRVGESEAGPVFQAIGRTFYAGCGESAGAITKVDWSTPGRETKASVRAVEALAACLGDTAKGHRSLAIFAMNAGQIDVAQAALVSAITAKSTPVDCWLALGDLLWERDRSAAAKQYGLYAKKAKVSADPEGMARAKTRAT